MKARSSSAGYGPSARSDGILSAYLELIKPGVTGLVMVTMLCGALSAPAPVALGQLLVALFGTALVVSSANAFNMYLERDTDALMSRTKDRPLPTGRLGPELVLAFAASTGILGTLVLFEFVGPLPALLALAAFVSYVMLYTPLKRWTPLALFVGAVPGAIPPLIGWTSVTGSLALAAWLPFAILFVWQLPHFLAIAVFRRDDYANAGLRVLPVVHGIQRTKWEMHAYALLLVLVSFAPLALGQVGIGYGVLAGLSGLWFLLLVAGLAAADDKRWARRVFFASMPHLTILLGALAIFSRR